jgi:hypothetical protein
VNRPMSVVVFAKAQKHRLRWAVGELDRTMKCATIPQRQITPFTRKSSLPELHSQREFAGLNEMAARVRIKSLSGVVGRAACQAIGQCGFWTFIDAVPLVIHCQ